jgi:hypothetical protein
LVGVLVDVRVGVLVGVLVGVRVGVFVEVFVDVLVGVRVGVFVGVAVGVRVLVGVGVAAEALLTIENRPNTHNKITTRQQERKITMVFFVILSSISSYSFWSDRLSG